MRGLATSLRNRHFWIILALFAFCVFLHYSKYVPLIHTDINAELGLERHAVERLFFLIPVIYAGLVFGLRGGITLLVMSIAAMLPRAFMVSDYPADAVLETVTIAAVGVVVNWWLESRRREIGQREQALLKLEAMRDELNSYIRVIKKSEKRLSVLHSVTAIINKSFTLDEVLSAVAEKVRELVDVEVVLIFLLNRRTKELELKVYQGLSDGVALELGKLKVGEGFSGIVDPRSGPHLTEDLAIDRQISVLVSKREGIRSQLAVPLMSGEKIVGKLCVASSVATFTKEDQELWMLIGAELGVAVEKAALREESERVGRRFQDLFERAHDGIWIHDLEGRFLAANRAASELTGYEIEELIGEEVSKLLTPQAQRLANRVRQAVLFGMEMQQPYELRLTRKDGKPVILMLTTSLVESEGMQPSFQTIARDVTRERRLQENLRLYVRQITQAYEEERKRIARELHDDPIQALVVLSLQIDNVMSGERQVPPEIVSQLEKVRGEIDEILDRMRRFLQDLRPPTLEYLGLLPALRELVSQLQQQAGLESSLQVSGAERHFAAEDELLIYRIVQEGLRNIWKHAEATKVEVTIEFRDNSTTVTIGDNGSGFEISEDSEFVQAGKIGLAGMQERADLLSATLKIQSKPGQGTKVILDVPKERWD